MPEFSFIIPAYNEQERISPTLLECIRYCYAKKVSAEIIVVNDGSTDDTQKVVEKIALENPAIKIHHIDAVSHQGKGNALRVGILASRGSWLFLMDADGASPVQTIDTLLAASQDKDIILGIRPHEHGIRRIIRSAFRIIYQTFFLPNILDAQTGYKLLRGDLARIAVAHTKMDGFAFDCELLLIASRLGAKFSQVPITWHPKAGSKVRILRDSFITLWECKKISWNILLGRYPKKEN